MPPMDAPAWWADVQQEREDLGEPGRRPAEDWLGEEIEFVPRRRITGASERPRRLRAVAAPADDVREDAEAVADEDLHGMFIPAPSARARAEEATSVVIELGGPAEAQDVEPEAPLPARRSHRTVQITGRPHELRVPSMARRYRRLTPHERLGPRPDRIAMWAVVLGILLIVLAALSS